MLSCVGSPSGAVPTTPPQPTPTNPYPHQPTPTPLIITNDHNDANHNPSYEGLLQRLFDQQSHLLSYFSLFLPHHHDHNHHYHQHNDIRGSIVGTRQDMHEAISFVTRGLVHCNIETDSLDHVQQVFDRLKRNEVRESLRERMGVGGGGRSRRLLYNMSDDNRPYHNFLTPSTNFSHHHQLTCLACHCCTQTP